MSIVKGIETFWKKSLRRHFFSVEKCFVTETQFFHGDVSLTVQSHIKKLKAKCQQGCDKICLLSKMYFGLHYKIRRNMDTASEFDKSRTF